MKWKTRRIVGIIMIAIAGIGIKIALVHNSQPIALGAILLLIFGLEVWREITIDTILKVEADPEDMAKWQELAKKYPSSGIKVIADENLGSLIKGWNTIKEQESKKGLWADWADYHWVDKKLAGEKVNLTDVDDPANAIRESLKGLEEISARDLAEIKAKAAQKRIDQTVADGGINPYIIREMERQLKESVAGTDWPEAEDGTLDDLIDHYNSKESIWRPAIVKHMTLKPCANCQTETSLYAADYDKPICSKYCDTTYAIEHLREDE